MGRTLGHSQGSTCMRLVPTAGTLTSSSSTLVLRPPSSSPKEPLETEEESGPGHSLPFSALLV